jgi:tripartite-type tricarboxylate transporter receptor subunit TctC
MAHPLSLATLAFAAFAYVPLCADAQQYPTKPITYIVPFTPGGSTDIVGRTVGQIVQNALGQPVVIDNRPGAAGAVGATYAAKAPADGYTLLGGTISTHAINPALYKNLQYDPLKDFEPITLVGFVPNALFVNPSLPVTNVQEFIALLKKDESVRMFASSGSGTSTHLAGELFADLLGIKVTHIPYKGSPQALQDVAGGSVPYTFDQLTAGLSLAKAGKLRLLAVTSPKRSAIAPDTPTMIESGVAGFESVSWQAVYAPKGTPKPIVTRLNEVIVAGLKSKETSDKLSGTLGMEVVASAPEALTTRMQTDIPRMADLVKKSGAKAD